MYNLEFIESIKIVPDKEKKILLKIQDEIEKKGISKENILALTKNLSDTQKNALKQLYSEQIEELNFSIQQHKKKILKIKSDLEKLKGSN